MFIRYFDSIPTARTILDRVLTVQVHTLSTRLQFKLSLAQRPSDWQRMHSNIDCNIFRLDCVRLARISTARSVRSLGRSAYDNRRSTNEQNTSTLVTITRNLQETSYTLDYNLTCTYNNPQHVSTALVIRTLAIPFVRSPFVRSTRRSYAQLYVVRLPLAQTSPHHSWPSLHEVP
jgi:hypothetical protein